MLIPVGNMNDKRRINANPGAAELGWLVFSFLGCFFFHWEKEIRGKESEKSTGTVLLKGLAFKLLNIGKRASEKMPCVEVMSVIACSQVQGLSAAGCACVAVAFSKCLPWGRLMTARALSVWYIPSSSSLSAIQFCLLPSQFFPPVLSTAAFAKSNKSHS